MSEEYLNENAVTMNPEEMYAVSFWPTLKNKLEYEKEQNLAHNISNADYDDWCDEDYMKFIRKNRKMSFLDNSEDRKKAILENKRNVYFPVDKNEFAIEEMPWYEFHSLNQVNKYKPLIEQAAREKNVDVDLLKAIVYMETSHGYYDIPFSK